ncbi:glutathione S-transferase T1 isoform X3 [Lactuca sativa]|uniref:GST N-terminal domain-containing protein n=1 Tax=Lactuca sativa TaxID=4236 RepID=A0A9R1X5G5_LACSA|nr:glutathione S-transferase T1 isoform X3 [Lactuca sativa]KAJ0201460.1 hypothetical protein LSAT_V11C600301430 [Lactuca sativa]
MALKVYGHRISEPSRAVIIFCKINRIDFEEIQVEVLKGQQFSKEYGAITPMRQIPAIVDGHLKLIESHAILIHLCCSFPGVASHWYPGDPQKRAKIHSILDWHHSHLRRGAGDGSFLGGSSQPSIADLSLSCEVMQLELLSEEDYHRILSPYKKVKKWIEDVRNATTPYFDEIHEYLFEYQKRIREQMATQSGKNKVRAKM